MKFIRTIDVKSLIIGFLVALLLILTLGANINKKITADTIKTRKIQILDEKGNVCGAFGSGEDGECMLVLGDIMAENRFKVWVTQSENPQGGNVVLTIKGKHGEMRATSGPYDNMRPGIYMTNERGGMAIDLGVAKKSGNGYVRTNIGDPNQKNTLSTETLGYPD